MINMYVDKVAHSIQKKLDQKIGNYIRRNHNNVVSAGRWNLIEQDTVHSFGKYYYLYDKWEMKYVFLLKVSYNDLLYIKITENEGDGW